ncbi:MAG: F0F1 ATP synthase subunit A [Deltaproteobacteria bacterium]|nr:F0F1 ATP synthase subunit A [Deltaproteobacteria bacterium]MBW1920959.1 F0F1 ATP synthase subunit A [Deltaproteobacteria bacterium]MBW1934854.1 F0F1 ATP synthase subunit A [Deltaproteobacteria bacterium]MBW1978014.1 F0F1 ATP synthase subunit A [Deltaproteobacteria bacterium]MBW2045666.1 F0F1 ATP synthase subunit A [Deltaproteobacteria bacterium]
MEHHYYFLVEILNRLGLGHFAHTQEHVIHSWLLMIILIIGSFLFGRSLSLIPRKGQNFLEVIVQTLEDFMVDITGPEGRAFFPFIATLFIYIFACNLLGLIPGFVSPTANINTTLSMAICTFFLTHYIGVKFHGVKYIRHFLGPVWPLAPLMFIIEWIGHFARVLSLSVRLFGNILGKEKILGILFALAGLYLAPLPVLFLGILVSFIQAVVFMLLSIVYFVGAMEEAH